MPGPPVKMTVTEPSDEFKEKNTQVAPYAWISKEKFKMPDWPPIHFPDDEDGPPSDHESDHEYPDNDEEEEDEGSEFVDESLEVNGVTVTDRSASDIASSVAISDVDSSTDAESFSISEPHSGETSPVRSGAPSPSPSISKAVLEASSKEDNGSGEDN